VAVGTVTDSGPSSAPTRSAGRWTRTLVLGTALLVAVTGLVYSFSLTGPFYLDDHRNLVRNPLIRDLAWFAHPTTIGQSTATDFHRHAFRTRYLTFLSFALS